MGRLSPEQKQRLKERRSVYDADWSTALRYLERAERTIGLGVGTLAAATPLGAVANLIPGVRDWIPDVQNIPEAVGSFWEQARQGDWDAGIEAYQDELDAGAGYWGLSELAGAFIPTGGPALAGGKLISAAPKIGSGFAKFAPAATREAIERAGTTAATRTGQVLRAPWEAEEAVGRAAVGGIQRLTRGGRAAPTTTPIPEEYPFPEDALDPSWDPALPGRRPAPGTPIGDAEGTRISKEGVLLDAEGFPFRTQPDELNMIWAGEDLPPGYPYRGPEPGVTNKQRLRREELAARMYRDDKLHLLDRKDFSAAILAQEARSRKVPATGKQALLSRIDFEVRKGELGTRVADPAKEWIDLLPEKYLDDLVFTFRRRKLENVFPPEEGRVLGQYHPAGGFKGDPAPGLSVLYGGRAPGIIEISKKFANFSNIADRVIIHEMVHHLEDFVSLSDINKLRNAHKKELGTKGVGSLEYRYTGGFREWFAEVLTDKALRDIYMETPVYKNVIEKVLAQIKIMAKATREFISKVLGRNDVAEDVYKKLMRGDYPVEERRAFQEDFFSLSITDPSDIGRVPSTRGALDPLSTYTGKAYRAYGAGEIFSRGERGTAADVIRYEQEELGNTFDLIDDETLSALDAYDADDVIWVTREPEEAARYGAGYARYSEASPAEQRQFIDETVTEVTEEVSGGKILDDLGDEGYLVLKPEAYRRAAATAPTEGALPPRVRDEILGVRKAVEEGVKDYRELGPLPDEVGGIPTREIPTDFRAGVDPQLGSMGMRRTLSPEDWELDDIQLEMAMDENLYALGGIENEMRKRGVELTDEIIGEINSSRARMTSTGDRANTLFYDAIARRHGGRSLANEFDILGDVPPSETGGQLDLNRMAADWDVIGQPEMGARATSDAARVMDETENLLYRTPIKRSRITSIGGQPVKQVPDVGETQQVTENIVETVRKELGGKLDQSVQENPLNPKETIFFTDEGVSIKATLTPSSISGNLRINAIESLEPGRGNINRWLKALAEIADENNITIELTATPFGTVKPLNTAQLKNIYKKFGFQFERGSADGIRIPVTAGARAATTEQARFASSLSGIDTIGASLDEGTAKVVDQAEWNADIVAARNEAFDTNFEPRDFTTEESFQTLKASNPQHWHVSPVCVNLSAAKIGRKLDPNDIAIGKAVVRVIDEIRPPSISLENVPDYTKTTLFKDITDALDRAGYNWDTNVVEAADYGAASTRKRLILRAVLPEAGQLPPLPQKTHAFSETGQGVDWYETLEDLIYAEVVAERGLPISAAFRSKTPGKQNDELSRIIKTFQRKEGDRLRLNPNEPIITMGGSASKGLPSARNAGNPAPTLMSTDRAVPRIILPGPGGFSDATVIRVTPEMMQRLMGIPEGFKVPTAPRLAKTTLGNGVHGAVTKGFIQPLVDIHRAAPQPGRQLGAEPRYLRAPVDDIGGRGRGDIVDESGAVGPTGRITGDIRRGTTLDPEMSQKMRATLGQQSTLSRWDKAKNVFLEWTGKAPLTAARTGAVKAGMKTKRIIEQQITSHASRVTATVRNGKRVFGALDENGRILDPAFSNKATTTLEDGHVVYVVKPTIQDVAARLPTYRPFMNEEQLQFMELLREIFETGTTKTTRGIQMDMPGWNAVLRDTLNFDPSRVRPDIEPGGFYLTRGSADLPQGARSYNDLLEALKPKPKRLNRRTVEENPAKAPSMDEAIRMGVKYNSLEDSLAEQIAHVGTQVADVNLSNLIRGTLKKTPKALRLHRIKDVVPGGMKNLQVGYVDDELADALRKATQPGKLAKVTSKLGAIREVNYIYRAFKATADLSAIGIHGAFAAFRRPNEWKNAAIISFKAAFAPDSVGIVDMFVKNADEEALAKGLPTSDIWASARLHLGGSGTEYSLPRLQELAERGPKAVKAAAGLFDRFNRSFGIFGDALRIGWANKLLKEELDRGFSLEEIWSSGKMEDIANVVNKLTGYSAQRFGGDVGDLLLFAPRFFQARFETYGQVLESAGRLATGRRQTISSREAFQTVLWTLGTAAFMTEFINHLNGHETDRRPWVNGRPNPNFYRIRYGGRDFSLFGPSIGFFQAIANVATGHPDRALRSLGSGASRIFWDNFITGRTFTGEEAFITDDPEGGKKIGRWNYWLETMIPIAPAQFLPSIGEGLKGIPGSIRQLQGEETDAPKGLDPLRKTAGAFLAAGTEVFGGPASEYSYMDRRDEYAKEAHQVPYDSLSGEQKTKVDERINKDFGLEYTGPGAEDYKKLDEIDQTFLREINLVAGKYLYGSVLAEEGWDIKTAREETSRLKSDRWREREKINERLYPGEREEEVFEIGSPEYNTQQYGKAFETATDNKGRLDFDLLNKLHGELWSTLDRVQGKRLLDDIRLIEKSSQFPAKIAKMSNAQRYAGVVKLNIDGMNIRYWEIEDLPQVRQEIARVAGVSLAEVAEYFEAPYTLREDRSEPGEKWATIHAAVRSAKGTNGIINQKQATFLKTAAQQKPGWVYGMIEGGYDFTGIGSVKANLREQLKDPNINLPEFNYENLLLGELTR